jgi:MFS superfamily sulfate permease-like transporter
VLLANAIDDIDYTGGKTLLELSRSLKQRGVVFAIADADPKVRRELKRFGVTAEIGANKVFDTVAEARAAFHADSRGWETPPA